MSGETINKDWWLQGVELTGRKRAVFSHLMYFVFSVRYIKQ